MKRHQTFGQISLEPEHSQSRGSNGGVSKNPTPSPSFFTERTLAAFLAVSDRTVRNWIRRGELASYKIGASRRIDPADVEDFLARRRQEAP